MLVPRHNAMVPCEAAGTWSGSAFASAANNTSTRRWDVSTLPAATAAPGAGLSKHPSGILKVNGRANPSLGGTSSSIRHWNAYSTGYSPNLTLPPFFMPVDEGTSYMLRGQVEDQPGGDTRYRIRMWEDGAPEPADWFFEMTVPAGGQPSGSLLFIVHDVDASIGNITVTPL